MAIADIVMSIQHKMAELVSQVNKMITIGPDLKLCPMAKCESKKIYEDGWFKQFLSRFILLHSTASLVRTAQLA